MLTSSEKERTLPPRAADMRSESEVSSRHVMVGLEG